jgi:hypothetical protein
LLLGRLGSLKWCFLLRVLLLLILITWQVCIFKEISLLIRLEESSNMNSTVAFNDERDLIKKGDEDIK